MGSPINAAASHLTSAAGMPWCSLLACPRHVRYRNEGFHDRGATCADCDRPSRLRRSSRPVGFHLRVRLCNEFACAHRAHRNAVDRRRLLISSMSLFAFLNIGAAMAHSFLALAAARVLLAFAAGLYTPNANALAGAVVSPEHRGRAIAICQRWVDDGDCSGRATRRIRWRSAWLAHDLRGCRCAFGHRVGRAQPGAETRRRCHAGLGVAR